MKYNQNRSLEIYLPCLSFSQLEALTLADFHDFKLETRPRPESWDSLFCQSTGLPDSFLTKWRLAQIDIDNDTQVACCCDPVLLQLTHRGAYMLGQQPLQFNTQQVDFILSQINQKLLGEGEKLYQVDKYSWLYTCNKDRELTSHSLIDLIGKDMFEFPISGENDDAWQRLTVEIQMLIKYLIDYNKLLEIPQETILNVHFSNMIKLTESNKKLPAKSNDLTVFSSNENFGKLCLRNDLSFRPVAEFTLEHSEKSVLLLFDNDNENYHQILSGCLNHLKNNELLMMSIICQDSVLKFSKQTTNSVGLLKKIFRKLTT